MWLYAITLCTINYKVFTKFLTNVIPTLITNIVGEHQTWGIRGRTMQTNTDITRTVLNFCIGDVRRVALIQTGLQKAFYRVIHDVLFSIFWYVGFGGVIIEGVRMAYTNCSTRTTINRQLCNSIPGLSFVRYGCPISPPLFSWYLELHCMTIERKPPIRGFDLQFVQVRNLSIC